MMMMITGGVWLLMFGKIPNIFGKFLENSGVLFMGGGTVTTNDTSVFIQVNMSYMNTITHSCVIRKVHLSKISN